MWNAWRIAPWTTLRTWLAAIWCAFYWGLPHIDGWSSAAAFEITGGLDMFRLWEGQWWRIWTSAFLHANLLHLIFNSSALWQLGRLIEPRWGTWRLMLFDLTALGFCGVLQSYSSSYVGLSGMAFAEFGLLFIWRQVDERLALYFPQQAVNSGLICLGVCVVLDWAGILPVANVAHISGWIYGMFAGVVCFGSIRQRAWWPLFITTHAFLIPLIYFAVHPVWNGNYYWWRGDNAKSPRERIHFYERATEISPELEGPWFNLALIEHETGHHLKAWQRLMLALKRYPANEKGGTLAFEIARSLTDPDEVAEARNLVKQELGPQGKLLESLLNQPRDFNWDEFMPSLRKVELNPPPKPLQHGTPDVKLPTKALDEGASPPQKRPLDPQQPDSAQAGESI